MSGTFDHADDRPHSVYRCYAGDVLLYVGCASNVADRMFHHLHPCNVGKVPNGWIAEHMTRYESVEYPTKAAARDAEREAIRGEGPLLNRQHNPTRFRKIHRVGWVMVPPIHPIAVEAFAWVPNVFAEDPTLAESA